MEIKMTPGEIAVQTTENRGHTPEELAANAVAKIISIPPINKPGPGKSLNIK